MGDSPVIDEINYGSADYETVLAWRDRILRRPLGRVLTDEDTTGEGGQRHFVLRASEEIVAGVIAMAHEPETMRLRQMWVRDEFFRRGLGRSLLNGVERLLLAEGVDHLTLHARLHVRGFYEACGYVAEGEVFEEIGIPHVRMSRQLGDS